MLRYLSDYKRESVLAPLFKMLAATVALFVPLVMADIVNVGIAAHDFHYILVRCGILLLLAIVGLACSLTAQYFSAKAAVGYSTGLRHALFEHIQTLSFSEMDTMGTSTLITRMTSDVNQVQSGLNLFLRLFLRSPFVVIGAMIMAFTVNFRAALIFVVAIPLLSVVVFGVMVITRPLYKSVQTRLDRVLGLTRENLTGVRVVRAFDKEKSEVDRFEDANELLTTMQLHVGHISALMNPLTYVIINLAIVALLYVGSIEINIGGMASGDVIALVNYMNQILVELVKLANLIVQVSKALACAGRVQAVLDTKPGTEFPAQLTRAQAHPASLTSASPPSAARPSASSAAPAAANPASSASSPASTTPPRAVWRSWADRSGSTPAPTCAARWLWSCRRPSSSAAPSARTCSGAARMPPTPTSGPHWKRHRLRSS